eukprot:3996364-Prymnesium_polylepis.1
MQQEYWTIVYYSLLISIARFLLTSAWKDTRSALPRGTEVTVEPHERSPITAKLMPGSYFAIVDVGSSEVGKDVMYTVRIGDGSTRQVRRELLRHRKWYCIAFLQFTNDPKHDHWSTTAFANRRQQFFQKLNDSGLQAALEFARDDRAEAKRLEDVAAADRSAAERAAAVAADPTTEAAAAIAAACRRHIRVANLPRPKVSTRKAPTEADFQQWLLELNEEEFWAWIEHSDNATHFKSKENLHYWSTRSGMDKVAFIRQVWVGFGCPGHGKGPWDGIGAMVKTKITRDVTNEQCLTPSGYIRSPLAAAQHARAIFATDEWAREHAYMEINRCVVMYLDKDQIHRPASPDDVSPVHSIMSHFSYLFFSSNTYLMRPYA